jgi:hypothetical protein
MQIDAADDDDIPEFDMSDTRPARHFERAGMRVIAIDADLAAQFPDSEHVNDALRELLDRRARS